MIKIRLCSDDLEEISNAIAYLEKTFPTLRFTAPRIGSNPRYADNPQYLSYGQPRQLNGKPRTPRFKARLNNLKK